MTNLPNFSEQLHSAQTFIEQNNDFLVVSHINPDGDAASSTCAIGWLLNRLGKTYTLANMDSMPERFSYVTGIDRIIGLQQLQLLPLFRHVIVVDCADYYRFGELHSRFSADVQLLNIDHHASNHHYGHLNLVNVKAAATAQVIYQLLHHMQVSLDKEIAECLYTGLLTDTGGFRYQNTTPEVMQIGSELLSYGVSPTDIAKIALEQLTTSHIAMLKKALATLSFNKNKSIAWVIASMDDLRETKATPDDLDGIVRYPVNVEGVEIGILFKQLKEQEFKISFRSNQYVDVSRLAGQFGGGGHLRAAGCNVQGTTDEVIARVLEAAERALE